MHDDVDTVINECRERFAEIVSRMFAAAGETLTVVIISEDLEDCLAELMARQTDRIARRFSDSVH